MKQALHIFRKDLRYLWREVAVVLVLAAMFAYVETRGGIVDNLFGTLLIPAFCWLIIRLILAETLAGDKQYWITRPYSWKSLLGSKILFIAALVSLPILFMQLSLVIAGGFPLGRCITGILWTQVLFWLCMSLPLAALSAAMTGIMPLVLTLFSLVIAVMVPLFALPFASDNGTVLGPFEWVKNTVFVITVAATATLVLRAQYKNRSTLFSRILLVTGAALAAIAYSYLPWPLAFAMQSGLQHRGFDGSMVRAGLAHTGFPPPQGLRDQFHQYRVQVPLAVDGVPKGIDVRVDAFRVELRWPDGHVLKTNPLLALQKRSSDENIFDGVTLVSQPLFDAEGDARPTVRGSVYLTLFGNTRSRTIPIRKTPVNVMDTLQCFKITLPGPQFLCRALFHWPNGIVSARFSQNDVRPLVRMISYSPFPAGLSLNPMETHSSEGTPTLDKEVDIIIKEPIAHIRRDFEADGAHIESFVLTP